MKMFRWLALSVFCGIVVSSCFDPPEYPDSPEISFKSVDFVKGGVDKTGARVSDTVILVINFKDGDGDVGVSSEETGPPFNDRWYFQREQLARDGQYPDDCSSYNKRCWFVFKTASEFNKYVDISDRKKAQYDTLKPYAKPYNCTNWEIRYYDHDNNPQTAQVPQDTLYFALNPHYNNIFVDFEIKNDNPADPSKPFDKFDELSYFTAPNCGVRIWNGRIPILSENLNSKTPLEGTIAYRIPSLFFTTIFASNTVRLRVHIEDRAFHKSNEIVTREFTFN